jgi:hypothetical protein
VKPREIRDDEGEEEVGWVITNSKVDDFLNKGDILLGQAMQALRHRHDSVRSHLLPPPPMRSRHDTTRHDTTHMTSRSSKERHRS